MKVIIEFVCFTCERHNDTHQGEQGFTWAVSRSMSLTDMIKDHVFNDHDVCIDVYEESEE